MEIQVPLKCRGVDAAEGTDVVGVVLLHELGGALHDPTDAEIAGIASTIRIVMPDEGTAWRPVSRGHVTSFLALLAPLMLVVALVGTAIPALTGQAPDVILAAPLLAAAGFVLLGLAIMCSAMVMRAFSWNAILRAAMPKARIKLADAMQGTFIGVLMSSTLPARLGEPSRALVVARRTGRPREYLPVVLGTLVSQTLLNILALAGLGAVMFSSIDLFNGHQDALVVAAIAPNLQRYLTGPLAEIPSTNAT